MLNKRMNLKIYQEEIKGYLLLLNLKIRKMDHVVDLYGFLDLIIFLFMIYS